MIPSLEGWPTKAKEAPSPHEVRLVPLYTNPVFQSLSGKFMFGQLHPPLAMLFHYHSSSSNGNSSRFQQIPYHQNHVTAEGQGHPENKKSSYNMLQTPVS